MVFSRTNAPEPRYQSPMEILHCPGMHGASQSDGDELQDWSQYAGLTPMSPCAFWPKFSQHQDYQSVTGTCKLAIEINLTRHPIMNVQTSSSSTPIVSELTPDDGGVSIHKIKYTTTMQTSSSVRIRNQNPLTNPQISKSKGIMQET